MIKKVINQNYNLNLELLNSIDSEYFFSKKQIDRRSKNKIPNKKIELNKVLQLENLKKDINSIQNCKLKDNSPTMCFGNGNINSQIVIVGGAPDAKDIRENKTFTGETEELLTKMLLAINIKIKNIYTTNVVNFNPPDDRRPTSYEIKRYKIFLQKHIIIINPKILVIMGSTAMDSMTNISQNISSERGWKEIIIGNKSFLSFITFHPSYLIRKPENKKLAWVDLKEIKKKIDELKLIV